MNRRIIVVLVSVLFITSIPTVIGNTCEPDSDDEIIFMRGLLFRGNRFGHIYKGYAIHLVIWYKTQSGLKREEYWFKSTAFNFPVYMGHMYEFGIGLFTYFFGRPLKGLEIAE